MASMVSALTVLRVCYIYITELERMLDLDFLLPMLADRSLGDSQEATMSISEPM